MIVNRDPKRDFTEFRSVPDGASFEARNFVYIKHADGCSCATSLLTGRVVGFGPLDSVYNVDEYIVVRKSDA